MFICDCGRQMTYNKAGQVHCSVCGRIDSTRWECTECKVTFQILPDGQFRCSHCGFVSTNPDLSLPLPPLPQKKAFSFFPFSFFQKVSFEIKELLKDLKFGLVVLRRLRR